jgi:hypothetical protein
MKSEHFWFMSGAGKGGIERGANFLIEYKI